MATSTIRQRQIEDGAINDAKVQAGAAIASSKLADGANWIKKDGSVAMTGALNMGSQLITNLNTPSASTDAATKAYVDSIATNFPNLFKYKEPVKAAAIGNILITNPGTAVFDGITLTSGDRLLLFNQTAPAENGIYTFNTSATALTRATDADSWAELLGAMVAVDQGTTLADKIYFQTANAGGTLDTTAIAFTLINAAAGYTTSNFVDKETPAGSINGSNVTFTLANTPTAGSEHVHLNGVLQDVGAGNDYTISGAVITMLTAPLTGEKIRVSYRK